MFAGLVGWLIPLAEQLVGQARSPVRITSVRRSPTLQRKLYRRFLAGQHPYPVAPPGTSLHEQGLAWDMTGDAAELARLGAVWERMGGRWGGRFRDPIHFEAGRTMISSHQPRTQRIQRVSTGRRMTRRQVAERTRRARRR